MLMSRVSRRNESVRARHLRLMIGLAAVTLMIPGTGRTDPAAISAGGFAHTQEFLLARLFTPVHWFDIAVYASGISDSSHSLRVLAQEKTRSSFPQYVLASDDAVVTPDVLQFSVDPSGLFTMAFDAALPNTGIWHLVLSSRTRLAVYGCYPFFAQGEEIFERPASQITGEVGSEAITSVDDCTVWGGNASGAFVLSPYG